jgi:hypothetical protein
MIPAILNKDHAAYEGLAGSSFQGNPCEMDRILGHGRKHQVRVIQIARRVWVPDGPAECPCTSAIVNRFAGVLIEKNSLRAIPTPWSSMRSCYAAVMRM